MSKNLLNMRPNESRESLVQNILQRMGSDLDQAMDLALANLRVRGVPHKEGEGILADAQVRFTFGLTEALLKSYPQDKRTRALATMILRMLEPELYDNFVSEIKRMGDIINAQPKDEKPEANP